MPNKFDYLNLIDKVVVIINNVDDNDLSNNKKIRSSLEISSNAAVQKTSGCCK